MLQQRMGGLMPERPSDDCIQIERFLQDRLFYLKRSRFRFHFIGTS